MARDVEERFLSGIVFLLNILDTKVERCKCTDFLISLPFQDGCRFMGLVAATGAEQGLLFTELLVITLTLQSFRFVRRSKLINLNQLKAYEKAGEKGAMSADV